MLGYLCAYYRHYYPFEFITSFLNNAANEDDIKNGTAYANKIGIQVTMPKYRLSRSDYFFDKEKGVIAKGLSSVKFIGNQRELLRLFDLFTKIFKSGSAKQINKQQVDGTPLGEIISRYSIGNTKAGTPAKSYKILDMESILHEVEEKILSLGLSDLDIKIKMENFKEAMGYAGYTSGKTEDRRKLFVVDTFPLYRKKDGKQFGYSIITRSIGSGKESRFTVFNRVYNIAPIKKDDLIYCKGFERDNGYFTLTAYDKIM